MKTDVDIQKEVIEELNKEPHYKGSEIGVAVKHGVVSLSGTVDSYWKKVTAEHAAGRVSGVRAIAEDIVVELTPGSEKTDAEIAEAVLEALKMQSCVPDERLKIKVEDGWVTLEGEVDWDFERKSVNSAFENIAGVTGVSNNIQLRDK